MSDDRTMKLVTNLDRAAIEARLSRVRAAAQTQGLGQLAGMFAAFEGLPRAQLEQRVREAQRWLAGRTEHGEIAALLDLVEMNLPNLK